MSEAAEKFMFNRDDCQNLINLINASTIKGAEIDAMMDLRNKIVWFANNIDKIQYVELDVE
jgi:hypothetical protein